MATLLKNIYSQEFIEKLSISLQDKYKILKKMSLKKLFLQMLGKILN